MNSNVQIFDTQVAFNDKPVDKYVVIGASLSILLIIIGLLVSGHLSAIFNPISWLIVLGGTIGATLINYSWHDIRYAWLSLRNILYQKDFRPQERIKLIVNLSNLVRKDGILVLENQAEQTYDPFLKLALELTVDGQSEEDIRRVLETETRSSLEMANRGSSVFQTMGTYAPALGLIGTIIGMMSMLSNMQDPATIGPAMALALTTTLYGAVLSNLFFLPIAGKLKNQSEEQLLVKAITIEGILSIRKQESPSILEQKLQGFLPLLPKI